MQLIKQEYVKGEGGQLTLVAETNEDLWHVFNLVAKGDHVKATTVRKVTRETSTGSQESEKKRLTLSVEVVDIDYDALGAQLRIRGKVNRCLECEVLTHIEFGLKNPRGHHEGVVSHAPVSSRCVVHPSLTL